MLLSFNASNAWGIRITPVSKASYDGLAAALASAEDLPDVLIGYSYQAPDAVIPLDPYVDDPQWGLPAAEQDAIPPAFWERDLSNGELLGSARLFLRQPALLQPLLGRGAGLHLAPRHPRPAKSPGLRRRPGRSGR